MISNLVARSHCLASARSVRASLVFALFLAWTAGVTTYLCFGVPMLALIAWSDYGEWLASWLVAADN
jgi:hypothetical protein